MNRSFSAVTARAAVLLCVTVLAACSTQSTAPSLDRSFGLALDTLRAQQTLNPAAGKQSDELPQGIDAESGSLIMNTYRESLRQPVQSPAGGVAGGIGVQ